MSKREFRREPLRVLIVDDDMVFGETLRSFLELDERLTVLAVVGGFRPALAVAISEPVELALVDMNLGAEDGLAFVDAAANLRPEIVSVVMSGLDVNEWQEQAFAVGAVGALEKREFLERGREFLLSLYSEATAEADLGAA